MNISEETLATWSKGPSQTETDKCGNAERAIRKAFDADPTMSQLDVSIFATGSYRARTNVKLDSDVDVCIRYNSGFFADYPEGMKDTDFGNKPSTYTYAEYKNQVENALRKYFGSTEVTRGKKAFTVKENSYRIVADVVPTWERRLYNKDGTFRAGVGFNTDDGKFIQNFPQQTYDNGVARNDETGRAYKRTIRILKRMRNKMQEDNITAANNVASFLIESLVWNAPIKSFQYSNWTDVIQSVLANLFNDTRESVDCSQWTEVNGIKFLFRPSQPWTKSQANQFLDAAWNYAGYK